jgi:Suppressor of fused protein (SUFU)
VIAAGASGRVGHGHTVEIDEGLWPGTAMNAWLLVSPVDGIVRRLDFAGLHVEFLQAIPLFPEERTWKAVHGVESLLIAWRNEGVQFWNPRRVPAVPSAY